MNQGDTLFQIVMSFEYMEHKHCFIQQQPNFSSKNPVRFNHMYYFTPFYSVYPKSWLLAMEVYRIDT